MPQTPQRTCRARSRATGHMRVTDAPLDSSAVSSTVATYTEVVGPARPIQRNTDSSEVAMRSARPGEGGEGVIEAQAGQGTRSRSRNTAVEPRQVLVRSARPKGARAAMKHGIAEVEAERSHSDPTTAHS